MKEKDPKVQALYQYPKISMFLDGKQSNGTFIAYRSALVRFNDYLLRKGYNCENIINAVLKKKVDVYVLLNDFIAGLRDISSLTVHTYVAAIRSYLARYDVDIIPSKFKHRVELPKNHRVKKEALDSEDIRKILGSCNNIRLKAWISVLASSGIRAQRECISIRYKDIDFTTSPTSINLRAAFTKTKTERTAYISDEATKFLQEWIDYKEEHREYIKKGEKIIKPKIVPEDLVFRANETGLDIERSIHNIYLSLHKEFIVLLDRVNLGDRREESRRRAIVPHSLRTFVYTVVEQQTNTGYAEYLLGHAGSTYHAEKEAKIRQTYRDKCMKYLQFSDFPTIQSVGKSFEAQMQQKDTQMQLVLEQLGELQKFRLDTLEKNKKDEEEFISNMKKAIKFEFKGNPEARKILEDKITRAEKNKEGLIQQIARIKKS